MMHRVVVVRLIDGLAAPRKYDLPSPAIVVVWTQFSFISGAAMRHGSLIRKENAGIFAGALYNSRSNFLKSLLPAPSLRYHFITLNNGLFLFPHCFAAPHCSLIAFVAPGVDQLFIPVNTNDFTVIGAPLAFHTPGIKMHLRHAEIEILFLAGAFGQQGRA